MKKYEGNLFWHILCTFFFFLNPAQAHIWVWPPFIQLHPGKTGKDVSNQWNHLISSLRTNLTVKIKDQFNSPMFRNNRFKAFQCTQKEIYVDQLVHACVSKSLVLISVWSLNKLYLGSAKTGYRRSLAVSCEGKRKTTLLVLLIFWSYMSKFNIVQLISPRRL